MIINSKTPYIVIMIIMGLFIVAFGVYILFFAHKGFDGETEAVITRIDVEYGTGDNDDHYDVYVSYEVDGVTYNDIMSDYYQSGYVVGKKIKIYYDPEDPSNIRGNSALAGYTAGGMGMILIVAGVVMAVKKEAVQD